MVSIDEKGFRLKQLSKHNKFSKRLNELPVIASKGKKIHVPPMSHPGKVDSLKNS